MEILLQIKQNLEIVPMQIVKTTNMSNAAGICVTIWKRNMNVNKKSGEEYRWNIHWAF